LRKFKLQILLLVVLVSILYFLQTHIHTENETETKPPADSDIIDISYDFSRDFTYQNYQHLTERILNFDKVTKIGKDQSGKYNMYMIELGNEDKPTLLVIAGMHGSEWQGTMYSMQFMEELRDDTFPDKDLRNKLLNDYHIAYIPVVNPWGYDHTTLYKLEAGRYNSRGVDLNRDFDKFSQAESRNVKRVMKRLKPFAFLDIHMMQSHYNGNRGNHIIIGNGQPQTNKIASTIVHSLSKYANQPVTRWDPPPKKHPLNEGLARTYMRDQSNPYTPYTLSYIIELTKPVWRKNGLDMPLTNPKIMKYGMAGMYLFFLTSTKYYEEHHELSVLPDLNQITRYAS
jgi:hypothetical protein